MVTRTRALTLLLLVAIVMHTSSGFRLVGAEEPALEAVLDTLGFANRRYEAALETFVPGTYNVTLYAEFAAYHMSNNLSWYAVQTDEYNLLFSGSEGGFGYASPPIVKSSSMNNGFGLSFISPEARYFTQIGKNPDGLRHSKIYRNLDNPDMYLIGFENTLGGGDGDYNDMVIALELVSPQVVTIGWRHWYFKNATNERAMLFLDGGQSFPVGSVNVLSFDDPLVKTKEKVLFINEMVSGGCNCLFNRYTLGYSDSGETWLQDAGNWLTLNYKSIFIFGFSAGGIVVANEIQKDYAPTLFSAAVVASAPVDWDDNSTARIFQSAHYAFKDRIATSFICGETDLCYPQMQTYYSGALIHKEWHAWNDGHDIFLNTCKDHPGETVSSAAINWFNTPHPPNHPSTPEGTIVGNRDTSYSYITYAIDPNDDDVCYQFDWGDNSTSTTGNQSSGVPISASHTWSSPGPYQIKVRAKDALTWSMWSPGLNISIDGAGPGGGGGEGCPTLFSWNGTSYVKEARLDIHGVSDVTVDYMVVHLKPGCRVSMFSLRELSNYTSHIDTVKLYATDNMGNLHECPLILAFHSRLGIVTNDLLFDDTMRINMTKPERIELMFLVPSCLQSIQYYVFELDGYNPKHSMD